MRRPEIYGLLADLGHICEESGVGAVLNAGAVPIHANLDGTSDVHRRLEQALTDGEDFELVYCVGEDEAERLRTHPPEGVSAVEIGAIVAGSGVTVLDEASRTLTFASAGWKHRW